MAHNAQKYIDAEKILPQPLAGQTCKTCIFYDNDCPFTRGKFMPYPSMVCSDYTSSVTKEQAQAQPDVDLYAEIASYLNRNVLNRINNSDIIEDFTTIEAGELARHFYELGLNARKEK